MEIDPVQRSSFLVDQWLPDETLFSLASRYHRLSGDLRPDRTCRQLFGHARHGAAHDFPVRLDEFARRTCNLLGAPEEVARRRTILPFYLPYRTAGDEANAMAAAKAGALGSIKGRLGILASRFGAAHPLKACAECMADDLAVHKVTYWHRNHQWPGCWICHKHGSVLKYALAKVNASGRFHWFLPDEVGLADGVTSDPFRTVDSSITRLAECSVGLGSLPTGFRLRPSHLLQTYRTRLSHLGLATAGRIDSDGLARSLSPVCLPLSKVEGLGVLSGAETTLTAQFVRMVREHRGVGHPLKHLVLVVALFEGWSPFLSCYLASGNTVPIEGTCGSGALHGRVLDATRERRRSALVSAVREGASSTAAAADHGVSVATAMAWLAKAGVSIARRPKKLTPEVRERAVRRLRRGASKQSVSAMADVSVQTVTLLLRTEPGLQRAWHEAMFAKRQRIARRSWARSSALLVSATPKALRQLQPAVFAWLYRNDRAWLSDFAESLGSARRSNNSAIKWDERDRLLALSVRKAALDLATREPGCRVKLSRLCDEIRELKPRLSSLDRLPLTRTALSEVVGNRWLET